MNTLETLLSDLKDEKNRNNKFKAILTQSRISAQNTITYLQFTNKVKNKIKTIIGSSNNF